MKLNEHLSYRQWQLLEETDKDFFKKVQFISSGSCVGDAKKEKRIALKKLQLDELFDSFFLNQTQTKEISLDKPTILYSGHEDRTEKFLKDKKINYKNLYNTPEVTKEVASKKKFHQTFKQNFIPHTVFSSEEAKDMKYPIIAKPEEGHSGIGIEVFKTYKDLKASKNKFDTFSEFIDVDIEFRVLLMKDKIVSIDERIRRNTVDSKKADESLDFVYVEQDPKKLPFYDKLKSMRDVFLDKIDLGIWSMDVIIDKNGKSFVLELNSNTGLSWVKPTLLYIAIYEDFYGQTLPRTFLDELNNKYLKPARKLLWETSEKWIKKSKWRIDYEKSIK